MHIVQAYERTPVPGWLTEGIADYARYKYGLYNKEGGWSLTEFRPEHHYTNSYRITARFFAWLEENIDPKIIDKLDIAARDNKYHDGIWEEITGKSVDELWTEYSKNPVLH
ncbi:MAG: basic secretory family protein, partial [Tannerella sp.]|jgi:hypothetical protein|nr:basic secretory family protein [Tannerella sp.]